MSSGSTRGGSRPPSTRTGWLRSVAMAEDLVARPRAYDEIDVSRWRISGEEVLGTKPKRWLAKPDTDERWLMKYATFNTSREGSTYRKGDDWAERVAYGVAGGIGLSAARVELCVDRKAREHVYGTICRSVLATGQDLVHGNALLAEQDVFVASRDRGLYTVEAIHGALEGCQSPADTLGGGSAWKAFVVRQPVPIRHACKAQALLVVANRGR